ncbi:MAG TPA: tetraacyldisaccharide 4'-kinase [Fibrobacteria bacterium]|nr:tetraacyldisaccharide 4'-kinase [Fibrobacteria bacterium]
MRFPERPSLPRKALLAPLSLTYGAVTAAHRALWLRPRLRDRAGLPPLIVIGSLRAGGAGKTAVTLALARALREDGLKVGILAYGIHGNRSGTVAHEVAPDSDWRDSSDEAVLLAREGRSRVFATRDREKAWKLLGRTGEFDILLSDDGLMDTRLRGAYRIALVRPGENPGWTDLLPAGPYRLAASFLRQIDHVLPAGEDFIRKPVLSPEWEPEKAYWALCGLGNPEAFVQAAREAGARIVGWSAGPDHGLPNLERALRQAARAGVDRFLCSEKDWIKLEGDPHRPQHLLRVGERVILAAKFMEAMRDRVPPRPRTS